MSTWLCALFCPLKNLPNAKLIVVQLGLREDGYYQLFEYSDNVFKVIEDSTQVARVLSKWPQDNALGPRRLYFKRYIYLPESPGEREETEAKDMASAGHYL